MEGVIMNTLRLSGVTSAGGGNYENVKIEGVVNIKGDLTCKDIAIGGVAKFSGDLICSKLTVEGTCKVAGAVKADKSELRGLLDVADDLEAEEFTGSGSFRIDGALNAERVDVDFVYGSAANEVFGEEIIIRKERHNGATEFIMDLIPWRHKGKSFRCNLIEGDLVNITATEAATVRGRNVTIGPDCKIDLVEYHEEIVVHPNAIIGKTIKLED